VHWTHIDEQIVGDVVVLELAGEATLDAEERRLRDVVTDLIASGRTKIVLDLARVPYVDSVGVGEMVRAYSAVVRAGGAFRLAAATRRVRDVLDATQLLPVLRHFETVDAAVASCSARS
jgi:anti-sigma B factor antagonist